MAIANEIVRLNKTAVHISRDSDFWITSNYENLHLINFLAVQERLARIDEKIREHLVFERNLIDGTPSEEPSKPSDEILAELPDAIKAYGDAISSLGRIKHSEAPDPHVVKILRAVKPKVMPEGSAFREALDNYDVESGRSKLVSTVLGPRTWFHRFVGRHHRLSLAFREKQQAGSSEITRYSEKKLKAVEFAIVGICLCLIQLLPVLALTLVSSKKVRLAIIVVLIVLVSVLNAAFANTVRATNFGAIAAYSAIVVVFISQSN
ncbi:hypothetical protein FB567DRAFT_528514 [Paraphoma chrysanthemicola]|uniref:DUF6594 domain-containing protein n=1 Tax=Paraphoma chrysanthemicola TaxID=798071 RepID=A0A8K0VWU9_9PLEO|nr:hypothetical protein FB567DRAFT_528514 [Paraphoma chrysanthemicola]